MSSKLEFVVTLLVMLHYVNVDNVTSNVTLYAMTLIYF